MNSLSFDESRIDDIPQVTEAENDFVTAPFSEEEVRAVVFGMESNKAPSPDGFPAEFYQKFWEVIKYDLLIFSMNFILVISPCLASTLG